jgi:hypothetical protein
VGWASRGRVDVGFWRGGGVVVGQGPVKVTIRPIRPPARHRGPTPRGRVGPGQEPDSGGKHARTFGTNRDLDRALPHPDGTAMRILGMRLLAMTGLPLASPRRSLPERRATPRRRGLGMDFQQVMRKRRMVRAPPSRGREESSAAGPGQGVDP